MSLCFFFFLHSVLISCHCSHHISVCPSFHLLEDHLFLFFDFHTVCLCMIIKVDSFYFIFSVAMYPFYLYFGMIQKCSNECWETWDLFWRQSCLDSQQNQCLVAPAEDRVVIRHLMDSDGKKLKYILHYLCLVAVFVGLRWRLEI